VTLPNFDLPEFFGLTPSRAAIHLLLASSRSNACCATADQLTSVWASSWFFRPSGSDRWILAIQCVLLRTPFGRGAGPGVRGGGGAAALLIGGALAAADRGLVVEI
jgi:hypothetical protein